MRGSRIQLIGQNHSCIEMTKFNLRKHRSTAADSMRGSRQSIKLSNHLIEADARRISARVTEWPRVTDLCVLQRQVPRKVVEHAQLVVV